MLKFRNILLASHGTEGGRAAEKLAFQFCGPNTILHHLVVVPEFWKGMMGDDWLNNASTREIYGNYVESQLEQEIRDHLRKLSREVGKRAIRYKYQVMQGKPTDCLLKRATEGRVDLVVIGSPRPRGKAGLRSRIQVDKLVGKLPAPLLIAPYPR